MADAANPEIDLTPEQRARIDEAFGELGADHYRTLGVVPGCDLASIKKAYRDQVREFHPDRYFRKQLGPYHARMVAILTQIEMAYDVLRSATSRREYDAEHGFQPPAPPAPAVDTAAKEDERKARALEALRVQVEARRARARGLAAQGARAAAQGDVTGAADAYRRAAELAPGDAAARGAHEAAQRAVDARAADALTKQAGFQERAGHWAEAARTWQRVVAARPDDDSARARLEAALVRARSERGGGA